MIMLVLKLLFGLSHELCRTLRLSNQAGIG